MQILLIRHGESEADILHVHEGRADFSLTERGVRQVRLMAASVMERFPPEIIWSSTLKRAKETATILAGTVQCPIRFEDDLMEHNNGVLAGVPYEEANKIPMPRYPHESIERGESSIAFRMRIEAVFSKIVAESAQERIAVVAHGGTLTRILLSFLNMPVNADIRFGMGDTSIHLIEIKDDMRAVYFLNDTSHLKNLQA